MRPYQGFFLIRSLTICLVALALAAPLARGQKDYVLHRFQFGKDGAIPHAPLIADSDGNLYGTTYVGGGAPACTLPGHFGCGTVFELTRTPGGWSEKVIYAFQGGTDGAVPSGGLIFDEAGNLYGTTIIGGGGNCSTDATPGCGIIFELSPPAQPGGTWSETVLYRASGVPIGIALPSGPLAFDSQGNLYGAAEEIDLADGTYQGVFELSPPPVGGDWTLSILTTFDKNDVFYPISGLVSDADGNLYGTTAGTGDFCSVGRGCGTVYQLTPPPLPGGVWTYNLLYAFQGSGGVFPYGNVILYQGTILGTASESGDPHCGCGVVYQLTPQGSTWTETVLYAFQGGADGSSPVAGVTVDGPDVYGTTTGGGVCRNSPYGCGTVFKLSPPSSAGGSWTESVVYSFQAGNDGAGPASSLIIADGWLLGTTDGGGDTDVCHTYHGCGAVFAVHK